MIGKEFDKGIPLRHDGVCRISVLLQRTAQKQIQMHDIYARKPTDDTLATFSGTQKTEN